ncbi:universal stress protein [Glaciibacter superstes]|uniref:universal stress protein n=1 Tax=Glaciibacter superstes TaxID=501023 RepID=UPI0003B5E6FE|nr:universal stress protein [Glaciibacter superstes]
MILVGVDGSTPSRAAVKWSIQRAAATGEDVIVAHVVDDEWGVVSYRLLDEVRVEAEALVAAEAAFARSIDPRVTVTTTLRDGNPMSELIAVAEDADLVVVGTHKTGFVRGRVFGSRSLQLAGGSPVPVAIIPESPARTRRGVVVGVNESAASREAIAFGADEAHRLGEELILVGAWANPDPAEIETSEARRRHTALVKSRIESVLLDARRQARAAYGDLTIRTRQTNRSAAETLVAAAASATLLVIGSSRRETAPTALGSVAHDVLINLAAPTVVVHAAGAPRDTVPERIPERAAK